MILLLQFLFQILIGYLAINLAMLLGQKLGKCFFKKEKNP